MAGPAFFGAQQFGASPWRNGVLRVWAGHFSYTSLAKRGSKKLADVTKTKNITFSLLFLTFSKSQVQIPYLIFATPLVRNGVPDHL